MAIDTNSLFARADSLSVAEYIGMNVVKKGARYCITCPGHEQRLGKPDTHIGNCVLTPKGYHCFACGVTIGMADMVMEYVGCSYREALETIAESCGGVAGFISKEGRELKRPTLSIEDLDLIGLCTGPTASMHSGKLFVNASDTKPFMKGNCAVLQKGDEYIVYQKVCGMNLSRLLTEEPRIYYELIARKAEEAMKKYRTAIKLYGTRNSSGASSVFEIANDNGSLSDADICGIKNALQKKYWRAKEIYDEYAEKVAS